VEGRKAQDGRSVETEDESVTGSVFLFFAVLSIGRTRTDSERSVRERGGVSGLARH